MTKMRALPAVIALALSLAAARPAAAQDLEPRLYTSAPVGTNFVATGIALSQGGVLFDPSVPLEDANIDVDGSFFAYVRALDAGGRAAKFDAVLPYACLKGTATLNGQTVARDVCGLADPRLRFSLNFKGAPALRPAEFAGFRQDLIVGASVQITTPGGQYDDSRLVNIGTNRWSVKPEIGFSKTFDGLTFEMAAAIAWYGDDRDFLYGTKAQDPIYSVQAHLIHIFPRGRWLAGNAIWHRGGRSIVDGVEGNDLQENSRLGISLGLPVSANSAIKLLASTGVSTRTGTDFDTLSLSWQYRWTGAP